MIRVATSASTGSLVENPYQRAACPGTCSPVNVPEGSDLQRLHKAKIEWDLLFKQKQKTANRAIVLTAHNQRTNKAWGDTLEEKDCTTTRIYALNVNGFTLDRRGGQFNELCQVAKEVQADIICCQEHNIDTMQTQVRSILFDTLRQHWPRSRITMGTTPIQFTSMFKPGGTMITAVNSIIGRMLGHTADKWGRWVSQTYRGRNNIRITIISAYQVVTDKPNAGVATAASQQRSLLLQTQDVLTEPRKAFKRDLQKFVQERLREGHEILLVGDFNESLGSEVDGMSKLSAELNLIDLMKLRHIQLSSPATYSRGRSRLDYGLASQRIANSLIKCGYEPFNSRFSTDHRAYFFDFSTDQLFGSETQPLASPTSRMLKSNNVEQVTNYIKETYERMASRHVFQRAERLSLPGDRHAFAERVDKDVVKASLDAEKQTKYFGEPAWSVALDKARKTVSVLKKCLSSIRTGLDHSTIIRSDLQKYGLDILLPTTLQECSSQLRTAQKAIKWLVANSFQQRETERNERIKALEESSLTADKALSTLLRRLRRTELIKRLFEKLKAIRARSQRSGVTRIEIPVHPFTDPKTCTEWQTIDVPEEIVHHLQCRNRKHFGQADGTPFTRAPLMNDIGFCGEGVGTDEILQGQYQSHPLSTQVQLLLQHLRLTDEIAHLRSFPTITQEELEGKLKAWRESTTTSPSGMHLGHYKSLLARHRYSHAIEETTTDSDSEDTERPTDYEQKCDYDRMQQAILRVHLLILNYALERGYSLNRWKTVANTILFKEQGNVKIHRTRVIHIYEADYNLVLGLKWRVALYQAEALKLLNKGQYGSRPRRNAIDPVMIEELQFEISRATRRTLIQTNYDAASCYDRIIPNLAMLASRRFGVHQSATLLNARTLQSARYHIRTDSSLSTTSYQHEADMPIYGTGQGSGNSPMIWCFSSSLLFDCYEEAAYQATYCNPDGSNPINLYMIGFVDDSNGQVNSFLREESHDELQRLIRQAEHNAITWSNLLEATGGSLELLKCSYHVVNWKFSIQGAPVLSSVKAQVQSISVPHSLTGELQTLEYLPPSVAHKTLGHFKEPTGTQRVQFQQLKKKSDHITDFLWTTQLTRQEAWTFYHSCYIPSVTYPLTSSFLTEKQLDKIQRRAMTIIYAKCGFNRHTKREVLFGPHEFGGAEFRRLFISQGLAQTKYFLRHWRLQSTVGKLLQCSLAWFQLSTGMSFSVLERTHIPLPHLESKWLSSLRDFLSMIDASIQVDVPNIPPKQREGDEYLMDVIINSKIFSKGDVRKINYCRLYLQAVTLSDITKPNGEDLDPSMLAGSPSMMSSITKLVTIHQERPSEKEWKLWRRANLLWSNNDGKLLRPLTKWLCTVQTQRQRHFAYTHRRTLYIREQNTTYVMYRMTGPLSYRLSSRRPCTLHHLPPQACPVEVTPMMESYWQLTGSHHQVMLPTAFPPSAMATFHQYIMTLSPWEIELLYHVRLSIDPCALCFELESTLKGVSDGSVRYHKQGAFGWVLSSGSGERVAFGMEPASGRSPTSYRAEAYALDYCPYCGFLYEFENMLQCMRSGLV
jgi:exonuclease III